MAYCSIAGKNKKPHKNEMLVKHLLKKKNVDFFLGMVIRMSPSLQNIIYSGAVDIEEKKNLRSGIFCVWFLCVYCVSLLAVLHVSLLTMQGQEKLWKRVCVIFGLRSKLTRFSQCLAPKLALLLHRDWPSKQFIRCCRV